MSAHFDLLCTDAATGARRGRLRTRHGVPASALDTESGVLDGLVEVTDGRAVLTRNGRLLANEISTRLNP